MVDFSASASPAGVEDLRWHRSRTRTRPHAYLSRTHACASISLQCVRSDVIAHGLVWRGVKPCVHEPCKHARTHARTHTRARARAHTMLSPTVLVACMEAITCNWLLHMFTVTLQNHWTIIQQCWHGPQVSPRLRQFRVCRVYDVRCWGTAQPCLSSDVARQRAAPWYVCVRVRARAKAVSVSRFRQSACLLRYASLMYPLRYSSLSPAASFVLFVLLGCLPPQMISGGSSTR